MTAGTRGGWHEECAVARVRPREEASVVSIPPTEPQYSTSESPRFQPRPRAALTALAIVVAIAVIAMLIWWLA